MDTSHHSDTPSYPGEVDAYLNPHTEDWHLRVGAVTASGDLVWIDAGLAYPRDSEVFGLSPLPFPRGELVHRVREE